MDKTPIFGLSLEERMRRLNERAMANPVIARLVERIGTPKTGPSAAA